MRVKYDNVGPVQMHDVRFINCSFSFSADPRSVELANYIATRQPMVLVGTAGPFRIEKRDVPIPSAPKH
jgi:hypothetical protein